MNNKRMWLKQNELSEKINLNQTGKYHLEITEVKRNPRMKSDSAADTEGRTTYKTDRKMLNFNLQHTKKRPAAPGEHRTRASVI